MGSRQKEKFTVRLAVSVDPPLPLMVTLTVKYHFFTTSRSILTKKVNYCNSICMIDGFYPFHSLALGLLHVIVDRVSQSGRSCLKAQRAITKMFGLGQKF